MVIQAEQRKVRMSITVAPELKILAKEVADENQTTPSGVISQCLEDLAKKRKEESLIKYYQDLTKEKEKFTQKSIPVIQKIAATWID